MVEQCAHLVIIVLKVHHHPSPAPLENTINLKNRPQFLHVYLALRDSIVKAVV